MTLDTGSSTRTTPSLSARQLEVLRLLADGATPQQIARALGISTNTCRDHIKRAREVLGCATALQTVIEAMRRGWLSPPAPRSIPNIGDIAG